jgi:hypothetical protein
MSFEIVPGNAIGCRTNAHRHGWDGSICEDACDWACGIEADFRAKYCANEIARCFHLHLFDDDEPHLVIPDSGVGWVLGQDETAFDDQILLIWAPQAEEPGGITPGKPAGSFMAGAYRVRCVERIEQRNHLEWKIIPYEDGWTFLGCLDLQAPRFIHLGGPYIKQVEASSLPTLFEAARKAGEEVDEIWSEGERDRLFHFADNLEAWMEIARQRAERFAAPAPQPSRVRRHVAEDQAPEVAPSAGSDGVLQPAARPSGRRTPTPPRTPRAEAPSEFPLFEEEKAAAIESTYGAETLSALRMASATQPLVILSGAPGSGKSRQALELIDDPRRERTLIVPVSASWRGRNDLLGYLNRGRNQFEPSLFTNFLRAAQLAWEYGDYSTRLVVFENFDLTPPENWLSEVLLRASYPLEHVADRTLDLPGDSVRGWEGPTQTSVFLSPAVRFVATVDEPVRAGALSTRLLDKAALIRLDITPRTALESSAVTLEKKLVTAIESLDECMRELGAGFNFSTAQSLKTGLAQAEAQGLDSWGVLDLVLCQELVSKLELSASPELPAELGARLAKWCSGPGKKLPQSVRRLIRWAEQAASVEA